MAALAWVVMLLHSINTGDGFLFLLCIILLIDRD